MKLPIYDRYHSLTDPVYTYEQQAKHSRVFLLISILIIFLLSLLIPVKTLAQSTKTFTVNMISDESDPNAGEIGDDGTCDVDPLTPGDQCTFRAAIQNHNGNRHLGQNRITFEIPNAPGTGAIIINVGSTGLGPLPPILGSVLITATNNDSRRIELNGSQAGPDAIGLRLLGGDCQISFFVINSFSSHGIFISGTPPPGGGQHRIENNYIGTDGTGTIAKGNGGDGIFIDNTPGCTIGGAGVLRNIISGNQGYGINITGLDPSQSGTNGAAFNLTIGNFIGIDISGDNALPNQKGAILLNNAPNNTIGAANETQGNKMAGNSNSNGVTITGSLTEGIKILGNFIGENKTGAKFAVGISALSAKPITIEGNVITEIVGVGVDLFVTADGSYNIRKNSFSGEMKIGTKLRFAEGRTVQMVYENNFHTGNGMAIDVEESFKGKIDWLVAGSTMKLGQTGANFIFHAAGNKDFNSGVYDANAGIAFNYVVDITEAVQMRMRVNGDVYSSNGAEGRKGRVVLKAGTEFSYAIIGSSAVNNGRDGDRLDVFADVNAIATLTSTDNRYALNAGGGLRWINDGKNLVTVRAFIERDIIDDNTIGGIEVTSFLTEKSILNNTITNNDGPGILVNGVTIAHIEGNTVSGNGTGILVNDAAKASMVGNTITANGKGVVIAGTGTGSALTANTIFKNNDLGIDLGNNGPTPNDAGDADNGPNALQNFPVLTAVNSTDGNTNVQGTLNSIPNTTFRLDIFSNDACNPSGFGEGQTFLDSFTVTTDANGNAAFATVLTGITLAAGTVVTATATSPDNNTSEFSACLQTAGIQTADLELTKKADKAQYNVGDLVTFTITLSNKGPGNASGIVVTDLLPAGITFVQATATAGTYNSTTGKWSVPALNSDQQAILTITGNITQAGSIVNTAEVTTANEPDTDSSPDNRVVTEDDQSSVSIQVTQVSDIEEQYRLLMQQITSLVNNGKLTPREGRILKHFIDLSLRLEKNGHIRPSIAVLKVFIIVVRNATHKTHLTNADRKALILSAQNIIEQLKSTQDSNAARWNDDPDKELARMESDATMELLGFTFKGNYPNPFSSFTTISFELVHTARVQLTVYDPGGRITQRLQDKTLPSGTYNITWQTPDIPAGIYILEVRVDDLVKRYKMIHL